MATADSAEIANRLLDAQVAFICAQLEGEALEPLISTGLDRMLATLGKLRVSDVVSAKAIKAVACKYALEMELGGEMPALIAEIAHRLYQHKVHGKTALSDLLPDRSFDEFLDKALELEELRLAIIHGAVTNPVFSALIAELLYSGIRGYVTSSGDMASRLPGARSALKLGRAVMSRASPDLGNVVEDNLKAYVHRNIKTSMAASESFLQRLFEDDAVRETVREQWDEVKHHRIAELQGFAAIEDVEEVFVILYEFWRHLRKTDFLRKLIESAVDGFFAHHKNTKLDALVAEVGVTRAMMLDDALRFAPPVIAALNKKKLLQPIIREQLAPFYDSDAARQILS